MTTVALTRPSWSRMIDPLRDARHREARAARECADWTQALVVQEKAERTRKAYAYTVWDLLEAFPEKEAAEFTTGDIEHLLARYPARGRPPRIAHLNSFFKYLYRRRLIPENPMDFLEPRRKRKPAIPEVFTDAEMSLLCTDDQDGRLMTLLFETGARNEEARKLQRRHANLGRGELVILKGKGSKDRIVPLTEAARAAVADFDLIERLNPDDFFWYCHPSGGRLRRSQPISGGAFADWFDRVLEQAGVEKGKRKPHSTRHSFATRWRRLGLDLDELQILLGHASIQTTSDLYVHTNVHDVARRMAEIEARV